MAATGLSDFDGLTSRFSVDEEEPVTLQIGIVASDGVLLASDKAQVEDSVHSEETKIITIPKHGIAYAFSGDRIARRAGKELESHLLNAQFNRGDVGGALEAIGNIVYSRYSGHPHFPRWTERRLLVALHPERQLWELVIDFNSHTRRVPDKAVAGGYETTVRYLVSRYLERRPLEKMAMNQLKPFAAHFILEGHSISQFTISKLQIVTVGPDGIKEVEPREIAVLTASSSELSTEIENRLFSLQTSPSESRRRTRRGAR